MGCKKNVEKETFLCKVAMIVSNSCFRRYNKRNCQKKLNEFQKKFSEKENFFFISPKYYEILFLGPKATQLSKKIE